MTPGVTEGWAAAWPFAAVLVALVVGPAWAPWLWHRPLARLALLLALAAPAGWALWQTQPGLLRHAVDEYAAFVALLGALYTLATGMKVDGPWRATPNGNTALLAVGGLLASALGTMGAAALLLQPLLRANAMRRHTMATVVFYIFIVANVGGLLTPLGDPPLLLGYLRGVPFFWTLRLWPAWALTLALLLLVYRAIDARAWAHESEQARQQTLVHGPLRWQLVGRHQAVGFVALVGLLLGGPNAGVGPWQTRGLMLAIAITARITTPEPRASWAPLVEVATVFLPLFIAMPAALQVVLSHAQLAPLHTPSQFFWASGLLSAVLDNAPCYLSFAALAQQRAHLDGASLTTLAGDPHGAMLLSAIAKGAVCMGAMTYIGNAPNLMVREAASRAGLKVPSFGGYMAWSAAILLPIMALLQWLHL